MQKLTGVILCGGLSVRMGRDKGLIYTDNGNWAQESEKLLKDVPLPVFISINALQQTAYSDCFPTAQLITDSESIAVKGPLLGILSIHEQFPGNDLLVLACDMCNIAQQLVQRLIDVYENNKGFNAFLFSHHVEPEPLFGIYCQEALAKIYRLAASGRLDKFSMKFMLSLVSPFYLPIPEKDKNSFINYNTVDE